MRYEDDSGTMEFVAGIVIGTVLGAGLALLFAPHSGNQVRTRLRRAVEGARTDALERWEDLTDDLKEAVETGRRRLRL